MFKNLKTNKKYQLIIVIIILVLLILGLFFVFRKKEANYDSKLINKDYGYIYTYTENNTGTFSKQVPHINLPVENINEEIDSFVSPYLNKDDNIITYDYSLTNNILSLVIRIISFKEQNAPINYFKTFNINLDSLEIISAEELLKLFKIDNDYVQKKLEKKFQDFYYELVFDAKVDESKCNLECFIERRGFFGYMQDVNYYVSDSKLIVYKPFIINSSTWEYKYFKDFSFSFEIVG